MFGRARGDVDLEKYHETPQRLAANASMIKMIIDQVSKKEMPPRNRQLQPTDAERTEIVKAMETLLKDAPGGGAAPQAEMAMAPKLSDPINVTAPSNQVVLCSFLPSMKTVKPLDFAASPA